MPGAEGFGVVKLKGILFGCDNWGTVLDEEPPYKNKKGIRMKKYLIIPGEHLLKQYPYLLEPGVLTYKNYALWMDYPTYWIDDKNPSRTNAIVRIDCGFDGRETPQTKRYKHLTDEIKTMSEENENLAISNMHMTEENKNLLGEKKEMIKEIIEMADMAKGGKSGREDYNSEER